MNSTRACGCKSYRSCRVCETELGLEPATIWQENAARSGGSGVFLYKGQEDDLVKEQHRFAGVRVIPDFITKEEEINLIKYLDELPWDLSQSGRRKQNYGPRANFKKRKAKVGSFQGFPAGTRFIQDRFQSQPLLESYRTVEQCSIEYSPETGSCIEPHIDDCWIWGERIVQLNLLSPTFLTFSPYTGDESKYNLSDVKLYPRTIRDGRVVFNPFTGKQESEPYTRDSHMTGQEKEILVRVALPPRSLLILFGPARYEWEHCVLRQDIQQRRVIIAYRELTPPFLPGGDQQELGRDILEQAAHFF